MQFPLFYIAYRQSVCFDPTELLQNGQMIVQQLRPSELTTQERFREMASSAFEVVYWHSHNECVVNQEWV